MEIVAIALRQRAIMRADTHAPIFAHILEVQGWMARVGLEQRKILVGKGANVRR